MTSPWMKKKTIVELLDCSKSYVDGLISGVRKEIASGRYNRYVIAGERYNILALLDYATYRTELEDKNLRKYIPPFQPKVLAELSGEMFNTEFGGKGEN